MTGCDRCGAQALAGETACPVCGLALRADGPAVRDRPHIPVRRHGRVPPPPREMVASPQAVAPVSIAALGLGALGTALIVSGIGYWLW